MKKTVGRPRKTKGLINVARWLPQMKRVCSYQIVLDQLDELEACHSSNPFSAPDFRDRIAQIKKDVANIA
jgi:hypothetical protein